MTDEQVEKITNALHLIFYALCALTGAVLGR